MKDPSPVSSPGLSDQPSEAPLDSWKEIATYVKRDVSTVQRWEKREDMPIHRHVHDKRGSVYAFGSELDAWLQSRRLRLEEEEKGKERRAETLVDAEGDRGPRGAPRARRWLVLGGVAVLTRVQKPGGTPAAQPITRNAVGRFVQRTVLLVIITGFAGAVLVWLLSGSAPVPTVTSSRPLTSGANVLSPNRFHIVFPQLLTDGGRIYFSVTPNFPRWDGRVRVVQVSMAGGDISHLPLPFDAFVLNLSPDNGRLLLREIRDVMRQEGPLWEVSTTGGNLMRLGNVVAQGGAWSPDGKKLFFSNGKALYIANHNGSDARKLQEVEGYAYWIRWSPNGSRLRFTLVDNNFATSLWEISEDGGDLHRLLPDWKPNAHECCGDWSRDGRYFVFTALEGGRSDVWILPEKTSVFGRGHEGPARLTAGPISYPTAIFAQDGKKLFAVSSTERGGLTRLNLKTRQLEPFLGGFRGGDVHYSRDDKWITYVGTNSGVWRSRADGSEALQLTWPPLQTMYPRWSPDGKQIAFIGKMPDGSYKLYLIEKEGGTPKQLIADERNESDPDWSPDGRTIIFGRPPDIIAEPGMRKAIHLLSLENGQVSTLPGSQGLFSPRWSRDGRYIAALTVKTPFKPVLYDVAAQRWKQLGFTGGNQAWAHDSKSFYAFGYDRLREEGKLPVYRIWLDGRIEELVDLRGIAQIPFTQCHCCWDGSMPDNSPLLSCGSVSSDIFALDLNTR